MADTDNTAFLNQLTALYQSAVNWSSPQGYGVTPSTGTAINTSTPFDTGAANNTIRGSADWFGAMQGSFNQSYAFVNQQFQRQTAVTALFTDRAYDLTSNFGQQLIDIQRMVAKRSTKRGLLSKLF